MAQYNFLRTSFVGGEITPQAAGRTDIATFLSSCKTMRNFLPTYYGSATRTPGTKYILPTLSSSNKSRLIPFEASDEETYLLEFSGNGKIAVITDDGYLVDSSSFTNGTFTGGITGWTTRNAGTGAVTGSSNQASFVGSGGNNARIYQALVNPSVNTYTVTVDVISNNVTYRVGTSIGGSELGTGTLTVGTGKTFTFTPTTNDCYVYVEFDATATLQLDNVVLSNPTIRLNHPYTEDELDELAYAQYNDVLYIVHQNYVPRRIVRRSVNHWQIHNFDSSTTTLVGDPANTYTEGPYLSLNTSSTTITMSGVSGSVTATASKALFESADVGRLIRWRSGSTTSEPGSVSYAGNGTQKNFNFDWTISSNSEITVYSVSNVGVYTTQTNPTNYTISGQQVVFGTAPASGVTVVISYAGYTAGTWGYGRITGYTSDTVVSLTVLSNFDRASIASTDWQLGAFAASVGYPRAVVFHEQRLWFGGTTGNPDLLYSSEAGDYLSYRPDSLALDGIVLTSSAITLSAASGRLSKIEWLTSRVNLVVGSSSSLYELVPQDGVGLSAVSLPSVLKRNENGTRAVPGIPIGTTVVYSNKAGNRLLEANYDLSVQSLISVDMSILSPDRFTSPIKRVIYQDEPDSIIWVLKEDGTLTSCTYIADQKIQSFAEQVISGTDAFIDDICVLQNGNRADLYLIVKRTINGSLVRYIEKLMPRFLYQDVKDAWFVHSGLPFDQTQSVQLTLSGTSGNITVSTVDAFFQAGDEGKVIKLVDSGTSMIITSRNSTTQVEATCYQTFPSTTIAADTWSLSTLSLSGLDHLEGESVTVFADGAWHNNKTVTGGAITFDRPTHYGVIGLGYDSVLITNDIAFDGQAGTALGNARKVRSITANIYDSVGGTVSTESGSSSQQIKIHDVTSYYSTPLATYTGETDLTIPSDFGLECRVRIDSSGPLPLTVLGMVIKCEIGGSR